MSRPKHFKEINKIHDCRVIIGGVGRKHQKEADRLAIVIMEASRRFRETVPQLTLRYYSDMDETVFRKAMDVNAEGTTFPMRRMYRLWKRSLAFRMRKPSNMCRSAAANTSWSVTA